MGFSNDGLVKESKDWGLRVSAPSRVDSVEEVVMEERGVELGRVGMMENLIMVRCWVKDPVKSMSYAVRDVAIVFGLAAAAAYFNNWLVWPLYRATQGTMFWALFVLGHD